MASEVLTFLLQSSTPTSPTSSFPHQVLCNLELSHPCTRCAFFAHLVNMFAVLPLLTAYTWKHQTLRATVISLFEPSQTALTGATPSREFWCCLQLPCFIIIIFKCVL